MTLFLFLSLYCKIRELQFILIYCFSGAPLILAPLPSIQLSNTPPSLKQQPSHIFQCVCVCVCVCVIKWISIKHCYFCQISAELFHTLPYWFLSAWICSCISDSCYYFSLFFHCFRALDDCYGYFNCFSDIDYVGTNIFV